MAERKNSKLTLRAHDSKFSAISAAALGAFIAWGSLSTGCIPGASDPLVAAVWFVAVTFIFHKLGLSWALLQRRQLLERSLKESMSRIRRPVQELQHQAGGRPIPPYHHQDFVRQFLPDRYENLSYLGEGGMGVVYRATDAERGHEVALKVLSPLVQGDPQAVRRFLNEAGTLGDLDHPGVVRVLDVRSDVLPYFSMELIKGTSLKEVLEDEGSLQVREALDFMTRFADALAHIHGRGVIHRDLKPSNIMVGPGGGLTLLDFGLARAGGARVISRTGDVLGTLRYMPPEQEDGSGDVSSASDIYSAAVVFCEVLTGVTMKRQLGRAHDPPFEALENCGVPSEMIEVICLCLDSDPACRPANGADLARRLELISRPSQDSA